MKSVVLNIKSGVQGLLFILNYAIWNCYVYRFDNVTIYNGKNSGAPSLGTFCGNVIPDTYTSSGRWAAIEFISDAGNQNQGFEMSYSCKKPCEDKRSAEFCNDKKENGKCNKKKIWKKCKKTCGKCWS